MPEQVGSPQLQPRGPAAAVLRMQRAYGNRVVQRLLARPTLSRKCGCGAALNVGRRCAECSDREAALQRAPATAEPAATESPADAPGVVQTVLDRPGTPLDAEVRACAEARLGANFDGVRVHTDALAAESAQAVAATAYTVGQHIVFDSGQYAPQTEAGQRLLLHELVHTVQQGGADAPRLDTALHVSDPAEPAELEADAVADAAMREQASAPAQREAPRIARQAPPGSTATETATQPAPATATPEAAAPTQTSTTAPLGAATAVAKTELKDADIERWLLSLLMSLVKSGQTKLNESYVKNLIDQRDKDPALAQAIAEAIKKVKPELQKSEYASVLSATAPASVPPIFAMGAITATITAGAQDVLKFIERRFVRDAGISTLDLLESMGKHYKSVNWVPDDYPDGSTISRPKTRKGDAPILKLTIHGGVFTVPTSAVSAPAPKAAAPEATPAGAKAPETAPAETKEGAKAGAAKPETRVVTISSGLTIEHAQTTILRGDKTTETAADEKIVIALDDKARFEVVGAVMTTNGERTTFTGGTTTVELPEGARATFTGPNEPKAKQLAEDFKGLLKEMRPNQGTTGVLKESSEFMPHMEAWVKYINREMEEIPGEEHTESNERKLNRLALPSFIAMREAARQDGIRLKVNNSSRTLKKATEIATSAANRNKAAFYSSHMFGFAIDFELSHVDLTPPPPPAASAAAESAPHEASKPPHEQNPTATTATTPDAHTQVAAQPPAKSKPNRPAPPKRLSYEISTRMPDVIDMRHSPVHKWLFLNAHKFDWHPYHNEPWHWEYNVPDLRKRFVVDACRSDDAKPNDVIEESYYDLCVDILIAWGVLEDPAKEQQKKSKKSGKK
jgi:hypothetical protein